MPIFFDFVGAAEVAILTAIIIIALSHMSVLFYQVVFPLHSARHEKYLKGVHLITIVAGQSTNSTSA